MTERRFNKLKACLDRRQPDLTVLTDNVHKPHNVSAIMRTCDAVGVHEFHAVLKTDEAFRARSGIAMGSDKWLDLNLHDDTTVATHALQKRGFAVVAVHKSERSTDFRDIDYRMPTAVLFGAELFGVSDAAASLADFHVSIPMMGMVESYNVSVAAAIVLLEAQRQRELDGMYAACRLDEATYRNTLFRWYRPAEAAFCLEHQIEFPLLDEKGDLLNPAEFEECRKKLG
ncbi:hypothetical protein AB833_11240 [Chromatiales bacterium (ex Bugula neritina AB1)]|nr:hypothetical protein AB833_11240 [Chromatiales bacterium (ex Bugula neritina AB1)]